MSRSLVALLLLALTSPAVAAQAIAVSVEDLARQSDAVVRGTVTGAKAQRTDDGLRIFTTVELRTVAQLRGSAPPRLRVNVPGGVVGRLGQRVDGAPAFAPGEDVVVFLRRTSADTFAVNGLAQGKFTIAGREVRPDLSHLTFVQTSIRAGERRAEEMPLAELEQRVRSTR
jgi:hypothetical protein